MLEGWCTGAPHAEVEAGVLSRPRTGATNHRQMVLLGAKTKGTRKDIGIHPCTEYVALFLCTGTACVCVLLPVYLFKSCPVSWQVDSS